MVRADDGRLADEHRVVPRKHLEITRAAVVARHHGARAAHIRDDARECFAADFGPLGEVLHGDDVAIQVGEVAGQEVGFAVDAAERVGSGKERAAARHGALDAGPQELVVDRLVAPAQDAQCDGGPLGPERTGDEVPARICQADLGAGREPWRRRLHVEGHTWRLCHHGRALSHTSKWSGRARPCGNLPP